MQLGLERTGHRSMPVLSEVRQITPRRSFQEFSQRKRRSVINIRRRRGGMEAEVISRPPHRFDEGAINSVLEFLSRNVDFLIRSAPIRRYAGADVADRNVTSPSDTSAGAWLSPSHPTCQRNSPRTFPLQSSAGFQMLIRGLSMLLWPNPGLPTSTNQSARQR